MKTLGIDYGRSKIGLAISEGTLAEPWKVIRVDSFEDAVGKVMQVIKVEQVEKVVSEFRKEKWEKSQKVCRKIGAETFDKTLTSLMPKLFREKPESAKEKARNGRCLRRFNYAPELFGSK